MSESFWKEILPAMSAGEMVRELLLIATLMVPAAIIRLLHVASLLELGVDIILMAVPWTLLILRLLTNRRHLVRLGSQNSVRELVSGTAILACMDLLGMLLTLLLLFRNTTLGGTGIGLGFLWWTVLIAPPAEEWFFRHILMNLLRHAGRKFRSLRRLLSAPILIAVSAAVFGLLHMADPFIKRSPVHIPSIIYSGAIFGAGYIRYGLAVAVLLHALSNLSVALLALIL